MYFYFVKNFLILKKVYLKNFGKIIKFDFLKIILLIKLIEILLVSSDLGLEIFL